LTPVQEKGIIYLVICFKKSGILFFINLIMSGGYLL